MRLPLLLGALGSVFAIAGVVTAPDVFNGVDLIAVLLLLASLATLALQRD